MDWQFLAPFLTATLLLLITPGPVVAIVVHNTLRNGSRAGIMTALGVELGEVLVLGVVFTGLILSQEFAPLLFRWVSLIGIFYLVWLAIRAFRSPRSPSHETVVGSTSRPIIDGMTIALSNPATLIFYAAFFPQFINPHYPLLEQLVVLGAIFLGGSLVFDLICIAAAAHLRPSRSLRPSGFGRFAEFGSAVLYLCIAAFALLGFANMPL